MPRRAGRARESALPSTQSSTGPEAAAAREERVRLAAWRVLLDLRAQSTLGEGAAATSAGEPPARLVRERGQGWLAAPGTDPAAAVLFDLYAPLVSLAPGATLAIGHLGQSLDGYIATLSGESSFVTGPENLLHLHRMRALSDAIVVGAETVAADDPQLTTRRVPGPSPVRVVIDPGRRLTAGHRLFTDRAAPTLLVCAAASVSAEGRCGTAEIVAVDGDGAGGLKPAGILTALHARGIRSVFIEGGGATVSRFLAAGVLDRLQVAVAPLVLGRGRPGLRLPPHDRLADALRLAPRVYGMGRDVLFDCDLRRAGACGEAPDGHGGLTRIT